MLGGDINNSTVRELEVLVDLISDNGFSNVLININAKIDEYGLEKINEIKNFNNVLFV